MEPFFSILTPTYNREEFLPRVIQSLESQDFKNFEWIVANDGSIDETHTLITSLAPNLSFPVKYIDSSLRVGKSKMDNLLLDNVSGKFILWCDSDDYLKKNILNKFYIIITQSQEIDFDALIGIFGVNDGTDGVLQTHFKNNVIPENGVYNYETLENMISGDSTIVVRSSLFNERRFPEVDFLTIESVLLRDIYKKKSFFFTNEVVKTMDRSAENSISHGKKLQYCRGSSLAIARTLNTKKFNKLSLISRAKTIINYSRYSLHGDLSLKDQYRQWPLLTKELWLFISLLPIAYLICLRDLMLGKVEKTHIEFNHNIKNTKISYYKYGFNKKS